MQSLISKKLGAGFTAALVILLAIGWVSYRAVTSSVQATLWVTHTHDVLQRLEEIFSLLKDAEAGQWSYLITGNERYLDRYRAANTEIEHKIPQFQQFIADDANLQNRLDALTPLIGEKLRALAEMIEVRQREGFAAAWQAVRIEKGEQLMATIRQAVHAMEDEERKLLAQRQVAAQRSVTLSIGIILIGSITGIVFVAAAGLLIARDVTERKQAEEALRESETRFRAIFENAAIGIGLSNMEGRLIRSNPAMREMLGYSEEELRRMVFTEFTYPDDRVLDWNLFKEVVENKREHYQREKRYLRKDGGLIWVRLTVSLIRGNAGAPQFAVGMVENITERKQVEAALRHSEEYFRALTENASDIITILSAEGTIMYESPAFERVFGYAQEEVIGRDAAEFVHPEDLAKVRNAFARRIQKPGSTASVEFRFLHKDGSWRVLDSIGKNMLDNPAVKGIIINSRDVTERKHAEHALQESEERFRSLSASSPVGIFSNDVKGDCVYTNPHWQEIAGMTLEESLGHGWANAIAPEDKESVIAEWQSCVREEREFFREFRFKQPNGEVRWVRSRAAALHSDSGARLGYVGTVEDFTERRHASMELERLRRQLELILTSVADGIYVLDRQGRTTFVNPAAERMVGFRSAELVGHPMHDLVHHSKPDGTPYPSDECQVYAALTDGAVHHVTTEVFWRKDGSSFPVEYRSAPIREQGEEIVGAAVTFRDVSEQRAVDKMKDEFVSVVSHELRTPLTSIRGALGLLASGLVGEFPERGQRMLEIATNNTERLVRLINDILDIERMRSGKVTMQRQACNAATLISQATDEMRAMADKAGVTLSVSSQSVRLWADPDRIIQTLTNLLSNAIKFSPEGGKVWLTVTPQGAEARFTIKDQGEGSR